jgi:hypothetical protein
MNMNDYILLMHNDTTSVMQDAMWEAYFSTLGTNDAFDGGSSIGGGQCFRKSDGTGPLATHLTGYIRVRAQSLKEATGFLDGNPVYECGGTVEIRHLPRD